MHYMLYLKTLWIILRNERNLPVLKDAIHVFKMFAVFKKFANKFSSSFNIDITVKSDNDPNKVTIQL